MQVQMRPSVETQSKMLRDPGCHNAKARRREDARTQQCKREERFA